MTAWALEKNRITLTALVIVVLAGAYAYLTLPQDEDPGFTIRTAMVLTYFPGASPERVENLVTDKIEEAVLEIPELDYVKSESRTGVSIVLVYIKERHREMRPIWDDLRRKVDRIATELPDSVIGPRVNDEFGDVFGVLLALTAEGYSYAEVEEIAESARSELLAIEEVSKVEIHGAQEERIFVEYNNARLAEFGLSVLQLERILVSANIIIPGGDVRVGPERIVLEPTGNFETLEDLGRTVIQVPGRQELLYLEDLAEIRRGYIDPPRSMTRSSGGRCLVLAVALREGGNVLTLGREVRRTLEHLEARYPIGVEFAVLADQPGRVERKVDEFVGNLLQAVLAVLLVMLLAFGLRTGLVVASLIPTAMLMSLAVMRVLGIGLDQVSLASLIIALGMLIDNAIVVSESIMVQTRGGTPPVEAAIASGRELRIPLLTSSLTTAAAFLPIFLARSMSGEYTGVIFKVVTITLLSSWVLALTMTPLLCVSLLRVKTTGKAGSDGSASRFLAFYRRLLLLFLRRRWAVLGATLVVFVLALSGFRYIPVLFFPPSDRQFFIAQLRLPTGTAIETTAETVDEVERFLADELAVSGARREGVTSWVSFIGGGEPRYILNANVEQPNPAYALLIVNTTSPDMVRPTIDRLYAYCEASHPDVVATVIPSGMGPPVQKPIQIRISGDDPDQLLAIAESVKQRLGESPGTLNIRDDWGRRTKKLLVRIDQPRARRAGVTSLDVAVSLQSILSGIASTEYREKSDLIPVTLRSSAAYRQDLSKLATMDVYSQATGRSVPLKQVADLEVAWEPSRIFRRDRTRTVTVECDLSSGVTANAVNRELVPWLEDRAASWPAGYRFELGGEIETSGKANSSIVAQLPVGGLIIVLLLVGQFNSFRRPFIVLATIPLGLIGVVAGLLITRSYFGFMTLLGIISLAGIVINNAIVLLDRIRIEIKDNGLPPQQAILEAAQRRLRPILLTTATTVCGLLPLWLGGGPMWEPMAIAIIFGLLLATVLTLGVVPVLYAILFRISFRGVRAS
jgi:multidrug efflux pump subunit AcrB